MAKNAVLSRKTYEKLMAQYTGREVSPSFLRSEVVLTNNSGKYRLEIKSIGGESSTERKLDRNDLFFVESILLGTIECAAGQEPKAAIKTYAPTATDLEVLYNGTLTLKTGSTVNFEMSSLNFKYIPETQSSATTQDMFNIEDAAYSGVEDVILHGTKSHEIWLEFPTIANMNIAGGEGLQRKAVLFLKGFIIKNGAAGL